MPTAGSSNVVGEGDSRIKLALLPDASARELSTGSISSETVFEALQKEVRWQKMYHATGEVPRLVAVQGAVDTQDGSKPVYRHPSDESPPLLPFTPTVDTIRKYAEAEVGHQLNHVLIQLYRSGEDFISEHSDKTLDIARGSCILNASFGARRTMRLRTKRDAAAARGEEGSATIQRTTQRIPMPHNSLFVLGLATNEKWLHGIQPDKRRKEERDEEELAFEGMRISLTFRNIATFLNADESDIWGQGAKNKAKGDAAPVVNGNETETRKVLEAFGRENRDSNFDWEKWYGEGFDVLHFTKI